MAGRAALTTVSCTSTLSRSAASIRLPATSSTLQLRHDISQVCRRWRRLLSAESSLKPLWRHLTIDLAHEIITAIHVPLHWSDREPSDEDFAAAFHRTTLSTAKMVAFITARPHAIKRLTLANSNGYVADDGTFVYIRPKHDFGLPQLGFVLGLLREDLEVAGLLGFLLPRTSDAMERWHVRPTELGTLAAYALFLFVPACCQLSTFVGTAAPL